MSQRVAKVRLNTSLLGTLHRVVTKLTTCCQPATRCQLSVVFSCALFLATRLSCPLLFTYFDLFRTVFIILDRYLPEPKTSKKESTFYDKKLTNLKYENCNLSAKYALNTHPHLSFCSSIRK